MHDSSPVNHNHRSPIKIQKSTIKTTQISPKTLTTKENTHSHSHSHSQENHRSNKKRKCGEIIGGTAAECAAVCCCAPCAVVDFFVLFVFKVPTGLCRKVWRKRKQRQRKLINKQQGLCATGAGAGAGTIKEVEFADVAVLDVVIRGNDENDVVELEKEMWDRFYWTGFWRSVSQKDT